MAVVPSTNIHLANNIRDVLNSAGGNVSDDVTTFFKSEARHNKWSFCKPYRYPKDFKLTIDEIKSIYCGITPVSNNKLLEACTNYGGSQVNNSPSVVESSHKEWVYTLPTGGSSQPLRLEDFTHPNGNQAGYNTDAKVPDSGWRDVSFDISLLRDAVATEVTSSVGSYVEDWKIDYKGFPMWASFNCKADIASWAGVGDTSGIEIPITYITGDRIISSEYWRIGIAVYIPNLATTGKWQIFVSSETLKSGNTSDAVAKILPSLGTNTTAIRQMLDSSNTSFDCIPCMVKNALLGKQQNTSVSPAVLNTYVHFSSSSALIYSMPSGQGLLKLKITDSSTSLPEVEGIMVVAKSPNGQWVLGRRKIGTAGTGSNQKNVYGLALVCTSAITKDTVVAVSYSYSYLSSSTSTSTTTTSSFVNETIKAGATSQLGDMTIDGKVLHNGIEMNFVTSSISWTKP